MMNRTIIIFSIFTALMLFASCSKSEKKPEPTQPETPAVQSAEKTEASPEDNQQEVVSQALVEVEALEQEAEKKIDKDNYKQQLADLEKEIQDDQ